jgi:hypothetical protein
MSHMNREYIVGMILGSVTEDSYGLWELFWELDSHFPNEPTEAKVAALRDALHEMISSGWVALWYATGGASTSETRVPADRVESVLADVRHFDTPATDEHIRALATEEGELIYQSGRFAPRIIEPAE